MNWQETLETKHALEDELKSRSQVFNASGKEIAASLFSQPLKAYYDLSFVEWIAVSRRQEELLSAMSRDICLVEEWCGQKLENVRYTGWLHIYRDWLSEQP